MDELLEQFLIEGRDLVLQGQADFAALRTNPGDARAIDSAFRAIHTLKGSVAIFAMAPAEKVLHAAETLLDRARKDPSGLAADALPGLVASLDQVDRWIDAMERDGTLGADADTIAARLLAEETEPAATTLADTLVATPAWTEILIAREQAAIASADAPLIAFRYTPDSEAFFRGDDPLALVSTIPALAALAILPAGGEWPDAATFDPFDCAMVIEGLAGGSLEDLKA